MCKSFYPVLFSAVLLVGALSFASTAAAQEVISDETTMLAADAANRQVEAKTDNVSVEREDGKVSAETSDVSTFNEASSQQSSLDVSQAQTDEDSGSEAESDVVSTAQTSGIPAGTSATGSNPDNPSSPPNLITIRVSDCTVSDGASITLEDIDGTEALFRDNERGIEITETSNEIRIEGPAGDFIGNHAELLDPDDRSFDTDGDYAVVTSTDISCRDGNNDDNDNNRNNDDDNDDNDNDRNTRVVIAEDAAHRQYGEDKVIVETIPDKGKLADTGGVPLVGVAFLGLASVGLGLSILRSATRRDP